MIIWPAGTPDIHENIAWSSLYLCIDVVGQNEIQVKWKSFTSLLTHIHDPWIIQLQDKGNWKLN